MAYSDFSFTFFRGDDRQITVTATAPGGGVQNLTGWTLWLTAKLAIADADAAKIFQRKTGGAGIVLTDATNGLATIAIAAADTDTLDGDTTLFVDLQGKDGSGNIATLATGKISVVAEITRATV